MPIRVSTWRYFRVMYAAYVLTIAGALPSFVFMFLSFGKKGLLAWLFYVGVWSALRTRLINWACPRCSRSFLGDRDLMKDLLAKKCCANCGLIQGMQVVRPSGSHLRARRTSTT